MFGATVSTPLPLLLEVPLRLRLGLRLVPRYFESLELDKGEWVESISKGETSIKEFLALVDESIRKVIGVNF